MSTSKIELKATIPTKMHEDLEKLCSEQFGSLNQDDINLMVGLAIGSHLWHWGVRGYETHRHSHNLDGM